MQWRARRIQSHRLQRLTDNRLALPGDLATTIKVGLKPVFHQDSAERVARVNQVLTDDQVRRIVRKSAELDEDGEFGRLVLVLAATGARFSQVSRMPTGFRPSS